MVCQDLSRSRLDRQEIAAADVVAFYVPMHTATRIAALFARDAANVVRLEVAPGTEGGLTPGKIVLSANAAEVGDNHGEVDAVVEGDETNISFSSEYLSDVLGVLSNDEIELQITGPLSPAIVRGQGLAEYTHVIMPMHTVR